MDYYQEEKLRNSFSKAKADLYAERKRINDLVRLLLAILPGRMLQKKLMWGPYPKTVKHILEYEIDP